MINWFGLREPNVWELIFLNHYRLTSNIWKKNDGWKVWKFECYKGTFKLATNGMEIKNSRLISEGGGELSFKRIVTNWMRIRNRKFESSSTYLKDRTIGDQPEWVNRIEKKIEKMVK